MNMVVTGSIAFDYLMSFPGKFTEHFLPDHMDRVSLSFLVDTMDKRRGGCAPNIAYTLALLGERPLLMATAGEDFGEYRRWLEAAGVDTSLVKQIDGKFCASFFCSTDADNNQIASFYTGAMADAGRAVVSDRRAMRAGDHLAERSRRDGAVRRGMPHAGHPYIFDPGQQCARMSGDELRDGVAARRSSSSTTTSSSSCGRRPGSAKTRSARSRGADRHPRRTWSSVITRDGTNRRRKRSRRIGSSIRPGSATHSEAD